MKNIAIAVCLTVCLTGYAFAGKRISNGHEATESYPWIAMLYHSDKGTLIGSGSLIHPQWILTAAHVVLNKSNNIEDFGIVIGVHDYANEVGTRPGIIQVIVHPQYDGLDYDIALIEIDPVPNEPVELVKHELNIIGMNSIVLGWGYTNRSNPSVLQSAEILIDNGSKCIKAFGTDFVPERMICADAGDTDSGKSDTCSGDSGGPALVRIGDILMLAGIISYGSGVCGKPDTPTVFMKVSAFSEWIRGYTDEDDEGSNGCFITEALK